MNLRTQYTTYSPIANPILLALRESLSRMLNTFLRETGQYHPQYYNSARLDLSLKVLLPHLEQTVYGNLLHLSPGGHHVFGDMFYVKVNEQLEEITMEDLLALLLHEVSFAEHDSESREMKKLELAELLLNSRNHMEDYLRHTAEQIAAPLDFRSCEQSLLCGHPFHPTPKSLEGFTDEDSAAYSPEYGTSFSLHCFAISLDYVVEDWLDVYSNHSEAKWIPKQMTTAARSKLLAEYENYAILPCHPWQAQYLLSLESVQEMIHNKHLIDLGITGPIVYPTSSVRTVWNPAQSCFYKLSLHIRITNFIRENNYEQLKRTLDAARIIKEVREYYVTDQFKILLEEGYRTVAIPGTEASVNEEIMSGFSMIVREAPEACLSSDQAPYVIASLLEIPPGQNEPILFRAIREGMPNRQPNWLEWLQLYLDISMKPIIHLFTEKGISLEAHVQNSMLSLANGMPAVFYVRDLEGISVNRDFAQREGWIDHILHADSPVLYSEEESRHRLKYYFFVNHLSHLIQRLAVFSGQDEKPFWLVVNHSLQQMRQESIDPYRQEVIDDILYCETLPAKANLLSRFHKRGETPLYVNISNPIRL